MRMRSNGKVREATKDAASPGSLTVRTQHLAHTSLTRKPQGPEKSGVSVIAHNPLCNSLLAMCTSQTGSEHDVEGRGEKRLETALATPAKDQSSVPSTHAGQLTTPASRNLMPSHGSHIRACKHTQRNK